jgi:hypothetical protein
MNQFQELFEGSSKYGDLAIQAGGISNQRVKYGHESHGFGPKNDCAGESQQ